MHSTVPGHLAWGLCNYGSPFINTFCHCLSNFGHTKAINDNRFYNEMAKHLAENPIEALVMNGTTQKYDIRCVLNTRFENISGRLGFPIVGLTKN